MNIPAPPSTLADDEVMADVRAAREALSAQFGHDVDRLFEEAKRRERAAGRALRAPSPRRLGGVGA